MDIKSLFLKSDKFSYFLTKFFLLLILVVILDQIAGSVINYFFFKQQNSRFAKTTYVLDSLNSDIVILGDSRAEHHYDPRIIGKILKNSCFNAGSDGQGIFYFKALENSVLNRYTPKVLILEIEDENLYFDQDSYDKLSYLAPYYYRHEEIREIVDVQSKIEKFKLLSRSYMYNSTVLIILKSFIKPKKYFNGYAPINADQVISIDHLKMSVAQEQHKIQVVDTLAVRILKSFIRDALKCGVKLVFVTSPYFHTYPFMGYDNLVKSISNEYNIPYINYSNSLFISKQPDLFMNPTHLNQKGAEIYSEIFGKKIKEILY